jgi:bacterial/archaeal transporter family protein
MSYILLIILTILGWGLGTFAYKLAGNFVHPFIMSTIITGLYFVLIPLAFIFLKFPRTINTPGFLYSLLGGVCMCVGTIAYMFALKKGEVGIVTSITALYPALTMALSMVFLGETLSVKKCIGLVLACVSFVVLASGK